MTATATKIPTITATSTVNFYDVLSSDGKTHYPLLVEGYGRVTCGCPAGMNGRSCYHRSYALEAIAYIDEEAFNRLAELELEVHEWRAAQGWLDTLEKIDEEADKDAYRDLFGWDSAA
jgi:hypothetical protein